MDYDSERNVARTDADQAGTLPDFRVSFESLAHRCEQATGPDRELGKGVLKACGWTEVIAFGHSWLRPDGSPLMASSLPDPTASLDAALTLVPEGWQWEVQGRGLALVHDGKKFIHKGRAATPALALCAAALRARAAMQAQ